MHPKVLPSALCNFLYHYLYDSHACFSISSSYYLKCIYVTEEQNYILVSRCAQCPAWRISVDDQCERLLGECTGPNQAESSASGRRTRSIDPRQTQSVHPTSQCLLMDCSIFLFLPHTKTLYFRLLCPSAPAAHLSNRDTLAKPFLLAPHFISFSAESE
jgi:hypothetical protein